VFKDLEFPPIDHTAISMLRDVQLRARAIEDPIEKEVFIMAATAEVPSEELIDEIFEVEAAKVIGTLHQPDRDRRFIFSDGMRFIGRAAAYNYFRNPEEFIDCLTVSFVEPCVLEPEVVAADFELFTFQVPVLSLAGLEPSG
jgi:hypothetical protein